MSIDNVKNYISTVRRDFADKPFSEDMASDDPFQQYAVWFQEAIDSQILDPYAACLSTATKDGIISSRMLYIRGVNVFWAELERQIRIEGKIKKVSSTISDQYFNARPRASQLGAWASNQSEILKDRNELTERLDYFDKKFKNMAVPRPPHWGGFCLTPMKLEFWQGRPSRLHDRIVYIRKESTWVKNRLSP
jgi:pyridoxamine 5'-phosphate oxidase